jgi:CDP-paratose 2-epimerase
VRVIVVTGSGGLVGSEAVRFYAPRTDVVVGIDNDLRARFFGPEASTGWNVEALKTRFANYRHETVDIRDADAIGRIFASSWAGAAPWGV